jgi:hypothetical protein
MSELSVSEFKRLVGEVWERIRRWKLRLLGKVTASRELFFRTVNLAAFLITTTSEALTQNHSIPSLYKAKQLL